MHQPPLPPRKYSWYSFQVRNVTVINPFVRSLLRNRRKTEKEKHLPLVNIGLTHP
jgi:hypothetical protein